MSVKYKNVVISIVVFCISSTVLFKVFVSDVAFNKLDWDEAQKSDYAACKRQEMVKDLKSRMLLSGVSKKEVINILGKPDAEYGRELNYVLGMCSGTGLDYDSLHVVFDQGWRLKTVNVRQH